MTTLTIASETEQGLVVRNLRKSYRKRPVIRDVSLELTRGEVVALLGPNGSGKTTSIAKLAHRFKSQGKSVLLLPSSVVVHGERFDSPIWAERNDVGIVRQHKDNADPAAVAFDPVTAALARDIDVVLIDTAGRLHTQRNLMDELEKVRRVIAKKIPDAPHHTWLVLDGTNGQNAIEQAKQFTAAVDVTGLIVAKLDGTARGGAVFGIHSALGLPVRYIGTGESLELLEPFVPEPFVDAIISRAIAEGAGS